jgi:flagellar hook assembly protein FlgD
MISIKLFNIRGELVKVLLNEEVEAGASHVIWDGSDGTGQQCASGIYFYETQALGKTMVNKMALVK